MTEEKKGSEVAVMLTVRQVSEITGANVSSIRVWLNNPTEREKRFPGAKKEMSPRGDYWVIPASDIEGYANKGRGRPFKPDSELMHKRRVVKG
jgi:hypothetical protein